MKFQTFISANSLPELAGAFAGSVAPIFQDGNDNAEVTVSLIGEPGVGKSFIAASLSKAVIGENVTARVMSVPREGMHDLILWSESNNGQLQNIQYDEASKRFVDDTYHSFVLQQRSEHPLPQHEKPGVVFIEHPEAETENRSDIVLTVMHSPQQISSIAAIRDQLSQASDQSKIQSLKAELAEIAAQGCVVVLETHGDRIKPEPLKDFFEEQESSGYVIKPVPSANTPSLDPL